MWPKEYASHFWDWVIKEYDFHHGFFASLLFALGQPSPCLEDTGQSCGMAHVSRNWDFWPIVRERLRPPNNHMTELGSRFSSLKKISALVCNVMVTSRKTLCQNHSAQLLPSSWSRKLCQIISVCFKLLNLGVICYAETDNPYRA